MSWTLKKSLSHIEERGENLDDVYVIEMLEDILTDWNQEDYRQRVNDALSVLEARTNALTPYDPNDPERND